MGREGDRGDAREAGAVLSWAELWGQALALMLAWPPITPHELLLWWTLGRPAARTLLSWGRETF